MSDLQKHPQSFGSQTKAAQQMLILKCSELIQGNF